MAERSRLGGPSRVNSPATATTTVSPTRSGTVNRTAGSLGCPAPDLIRSPMPSLRRFEIALELAGRALGTIHQALGLQSTIPGRSSHLLLDLAFYLRSPPHELVPSCSHRCSILPREVSSADAFPRLV